MRRASRARQKGLWLPLAVLGLIGIVALYLWVVLSWSYSSGERAGWVQKLSKKGWLCKTWEGELAMVSLPGSTPEKFYFTVRDEAVADAVNQSMGRRVSLHYEEKVGLPTSCFGETRHFVTKVIQVPEMPYGPGGIPAPTAPAAPGSAAPAAPDGAGAAPAQPPAPALPAAPPVPAAPAPAAPPAAPR